MDVLNWVKISILDYNIGKSFTTNLGLQFPDNYSYTELGELEIDRSESSTITWTPDGKIRKIQLGSGNFSQIEFYYDARGDRVAKIGRSSSTNSPVDSYTIYHRDAAGNVLAIYDNTQNEVKEGEWICVELNYECALPSDQTVTVCIEPGKWYEDGNKIVIEDFYVDHPDPQSSCNDGFYSSLTFNITDNSYLGADPNPTDVFKIESWNIETRSGGQAEEQINLAEWHLYGSSAQGRVATVKPDGIEYANSLAESATFGYLSRELSEKFFEVKDHLGNIRLVFSDLKKVEPVTNRKPYALDLTAVNNYYPFGMLMPENNWQSGLSRYGFNGYENDNEIKGVGNALGTPFRPYDPRLGRWMEPDPIYKHFQSNYVAFRNNPIYWVDPSGMDDAAPTAEEDEEEELGKKAQTEDKVKQGFVIGTGTKEVSKVIAKEAVVKTTTTTTVAESSGSLLGGIFAAIVIFFTPTEIGGGDLEPQTTQPEVDLEPKKQPQQIPTISPVPEDPVEQEGPIYVYRTMKQQIPTNYPQTGETATTLGVRPGIDIDISFNGYVYPFNIDKNGMSVARDPSLMHFVRKPVALGGESSNPLWRIDIEKLPQGLMYIEDNGPIHGTIQPSYPMNYDTYLKLIHNTQSSWVKVPLNNKEIP